MSTALARRSFDDIDCGPAMQLADLVEGQIYTHDQVGEAFSMKPAVLSWQGGIISRPQHEALLVITKDDLASIDDLR